MSSAQRPSNQLLQALPFEEFELLGPRLKPLQLIRETVLVEAGVAPPQIVFPHGGAVSIVVNLSEGQTVEVAMIGRDGVVGAGEALGDGVSLTDAIVLFPGAASAIELADFRIAAAQSPALRGLVSRHGEALLTQAQQTAACNAVHSVEARLSRWLLRARDLHDGRTLPLTQELLAQMIGVRRNAVSIVAHALQEAGIISYSRGQIEIVDLEALRQASCECYATIRTRQKQLLGD
ncbi:MAG TPA: Crp/Fnr family transcriptional regulator [Bryobacteraceae bacterium]